MSARTKKIAAGTAVAGIGVMIGRRFGPKAHAACAAKCGGTCKPDGAESPRRMCNHGTAEREVHHAA